MICDVIEMLCSMIRGSRLGPVEESIVDEMVEGMPCPDEANELGRIDRERGTVEKGNG